jgi:glutamate/tyrosine decarboxylase-like PLP-dependent enzyme
MATVEPGTAPGRQEAQEAGAELLDQARTYALEYMAGIGERSVFPTPESLEGLDVFDEPLPELPGVPEEILRRLHESGSPATVATTGGRYFGFVTGGALPVALAARWLGDVWDQVAALHLLSPVVSRLESLCEKWVVELLGLPAGTAAGFVSGTSSATFCGLAAGRDELLRRAGWEAGERGLFSAPELRVVMTAQAHATVHKALALLGLGRARVERVGVDGQGRMIASEMPPLDSRCLVIAQAGNVNSGSFDPLGEIGALVRRAEAWLHVDGAFGLWAAASRSRRRLTAGLEMADSWAVDAHKTLNTPYDCGIILCRHPRSLVSALHAADSYILYGEHRDGMLFTPEMSRRSRAVELWATLKALGRTGVEDLVDRLCGHAARFGRELQARGFRILNDVVFNQVLVSCDEPALTTATLRHLQQSGECWCGGAVWEGEPVIRISVCSWATTSADVDRSVAAFVQARERARREAEISASSR